MDAFLRKYFWVVELGLLATAAFFVAAIGNTFVAAKLMPLPEMPKFDTPLPSSQGHTDNAANLEDVKKSNIFKTPRSEPVKLDTSVSVKEPTPESLEPILSGIKYQLVGTVVADDPRWSLCVLVESGTRSPGLYGVGSVLAEEYKIIKVTRKRVTLRHGSRLEYLDLEEDAANPKKPVAAAGKEEGGGGDGVKDLGNGKFVVAQSEIDSTLTNLNQVAMQARIQPNFEGGKANGFKMFSIKPGSIYSKIGLQNGDVIKKINNFEMNSPDKALEIYQKLREAKHITIEIDRNGKASTMEYTIR
jgi:general secretion pathway protein C